MINLWVWTGALSILWLGIVVVWSIIVPERRIWPSGQVNALKILYIWVPFLLFWLSLIMVALGDWNYFAWPDTLRWWGGIPLLILGHIVVYSGVFKIGAHATSGAATGLKTDGWYAYSRNPQYVADIAILCGWVVLSASLAVLPLAFAGIFIFILAPFSEEPWLREKYGKPYIDYCKRVRRFL